MGEFMEKGKISIIIPVFNTVRYLSQCLESILRQSYPNFEIRIIDDNSTDGTSQLCDEWERKDSHIRVIHKENHGVSVARNRGITETDGEYFLFVDGDDAIHPDMLKTLLKVIEEQKADLAVCGFREWKGEPLQKLALEETEKCKNSGLTLKTADKDSYVKNYLLNGYTRCWSVLYRRETLGKARFPEGISIGEDMLFLVDTLKYMKKAVILDFAGYYYRLNEAGAMQRAFRPSYMDQILCWQKAEEILTPAYPECREKIQSIQIVSAMLTAGKLAALAGKERRAQAMYVKQCRDVVKKLWKIKAVRRLLDRGYRVKTALFRYFPRLYLALYHIWKKG